MNQKKQKQTLRYREQTAAGQDQFARWEGAGGLGEKDEKVKGAKYGDGR